MTDGCALWNSPIISTYLVWELVRGYEGIDRGGMPLLLVFVALAMLGNPLFRNLLAAHSFTGLEDFSRAIRNSSRKDSISLGGLSEAIVESRESSRGAIEFALAAKLVTLSATTATLSAVYACDNRRAETKARKFRRGEGALARRVGAWFAAESPERIALFLGVNF